MTGWAFVKLGDLTTVVTKGTTPTSIGYEFKDAGINFVKVESISNNGTFIPDKFAKIDDECNAQLKRSQLEENDILFSIAGAIGRTAIVPKSILPANTNQALAIIRLKPDAPIYPDYLLRALASQSIIEQTDLMKGGVAQQNLSLAQLKAFEIPLPPLPVQKAIVAKLDAAFASIEQAIAAAEQNAENAKQLFQSYLSDVFERGGEGWVEQTLGSVCKFIGGSQPPKSSFEKAVAADNIRLIQIRDYKSDKHITYIKRSAARRFCTAEDIMIGRYGPPIFQILRGLEGAYNVALMKAEPNQKYLSRDYLFYFLQHPAIQNHVINASTRAAGQSGMNKETIEPYPIRLPSLSEQASIVTAVLSMSEESKSLVRKYSEKCELLNQLKQSLLNQAFNGQLVDA